MHHDSYDSFTFNSIWMFYIHQWLKPTYGLIPQVNPMSHVMWDMWVAVLIWGFPSIVMGVPQKRWMVEKEKIASKWMMTGGTPILGNPHIIHGNMPKMKNWVQHMSTNPFVSWGFCNDTLCERCQCQCQQHLAACEDLGMKQLLTRVKEFETCT